MTGYIIQVPVLFDMSGDTLVYGEDGTQSDFIANHLEFNLLMRDKVARFSVSTDNSIHGHKKYDQICGQL